MDKRARNEFADTLLQTVKAKFVNEGLMREVRCHLQNRILDLMRGEDDNGVPVMGGFVDDDDVDMRIVLTNQLIMEYLHWYGYKYTAQTLSMETGMVNKPPRRESLEGMMGAHRIRELPILLEFVAKTAERHRRRILALQSMEESYLDSTCANHNQRLFPREELAAAAHTTGQKRGCPTAKMDNPKKNGNVAGKNRSKTLQQSQTADDESNEREHEQLEMTGNQRGSRFYEYNKEYTYDTDAASEAASEAASDTTSEAPSEATCEPMSTATSMSASTATSMATATTTYAATYEATSSENASCRKVRQMKYENVEDISDLDLNTSGYSCEESYDDTEDRFELQSQESDVTEYEEEQTEFDDYSDNDDQYTNDFSRATV